jgi:metal-responsive CopG/Arc/MetJ family transcriptional regulator
VARILSVSVPDELLDEAEELARAKGKTKSEFARDALVREVRLERFRTLQQYVRGQAEQRGIGPEDAERIVDEIRAEG